MSDVMPPVIHTGEFIAYAMKYANPEIVKQAIAQAVELVEMLLGEPAEGLSFRPSARQAGNNEKKLCPVMIVCDVSVQEGFELPSGSTYDTVGGFISELTLMLRDMGVEDKGLNWNAVNRDGRIYIEPPA